MTTETLTIVMIAAGCVFAIASVFYGIFRKFTQMSWLSYQIPLVFLIVALLRVIPEGAVPGSKFYLGVAITVAATALIVGGGALLRQAMLKKRMPAHGAWRFLNRLLGGVTALWDYIMIVAVLGAAVLSFFAYVYDPLPDLFGAVFELGIWKNFFAYHALDLVLVTGLVFAMRGGWRVGVARVIVIILMLALSFGSVALALYLSVFVPFFSDMAGGMAAGMAVASPAVAQIISTAIVAFILFVIFFIISCILGFFTVKLIRRIRYDYFWGTLDAVIGCALSLLVALLVLMGLYAGFAALADGTVTAAVENLIAQISESAGDAVSYLQPAVDALKNLEGALQSYAAWLQSAPLSAAFFSNPFALH